MSADLHQHRFSLAQYHEMIERGILTEDDRVELLRGAIVSMSPIGNRHIAAVNRLTRFFVLALGDRGVVSVQNPIATPPDSEPQPDVVILRPRDDLYDTTRPSAEATLLAVEVADSSLALDRGLKLSIYAEAGVPEYWVLDLKHDVIEVYRAPEDGRYAEMHTVHRGERIAPLAFPDVVATSDALIPTR
ncbi:MAG: Uma2 family endonuclease [bacterium]|nr:Uma2 family endonuclease [bacterium]